MGFLDANRPIISLALRGTQLLFSILVLGLAAATLSKEGFNDDSMSLSVATSVLSLLYLAAVLVPQAIAFIPGLVVAIADFILFVLWLASMGRTADYWGSVSCDITYYSTYYKTIFNDACKLAKATLAFNVLQFVLFGIGFVLHVIFVLVPYAKSGFQTYASKGGYLAQGGIFSTGVVAHDEEAVRTEEEFKAGESTDDAEKYKSTDNIEPTVDVSEPTAAEPVAEPVEPTHK